MSFDEMQPYRYLAVAVLHKALVDTRSVHQDIAARAAAWLRGGDDLLALWCALAGIDLDTVRRARLGVHRPITRPRAASTAPAGSTSPSATSAR